MPIVLCHLPKLFIFTIKGKLLCRAQQYGFPYFQKMQEITFMSWTWANIWIIQIQQEFRWVDLSCCFPFMMRCVHVLIYLLKWRVNVTIVVWLAALLYLHHVSVLCGHIWNQLATNAIFKPLKPIKLFWPPSRSELLSIVRSDNCICLLCIWHTRWAKCCKTSCGGPFFWYFNA